MSKTVREWMQTEVWSSRTSRKVVVSFFVLVLLAYGAIYIFEHWLNPWERQAGKTMLKHAEIVRSASLEGIGKEVEAAKASEDLAESRVWTLRDQRVEIAISGLILVAEMCRKSELTPVAAHPGDSATKHQWTEQQTQMGSMMCNVYETDELASRHALNTRLGF